ncbi:flagellar biosynthesis anti-sigma factor FlgM [Tissierella sp. Yu-01]|uniref:flagellar biosynthesis anti-sigma factor FlgM n=1 Tax=Tissierella sp. Yu-01 TaxID=3035694 RepID=UPI00240DD9F0|nr:flagellar biosynthesis anti-sigma factor FlgM [Tissierella sp. Yu-01]WFA07928.1 flagellar biosynthesis anti-sigma factor FlgM [Tissierella sp. Yu-01]
MKINNIQNKFVDISLYKSNEKKSSEKEINPKNSVNIQISDSAKALVEKINQSNDIKYSDKVEKIRKSILEGSYKVSSENIANKLLQAMEEQKGSDK